MKKIAVFLLSFLLFAACCKFDLDSNNKNMSFTVSIPGDPVQLSGNPIYIDVVNSNSGLTKQKTLLRVTSSNSNFVGGPFVDSIPGNNVTFNISGLVDVAFDYEFKTNELFVYELHSALTLNLQIEVGESYFDSNGEYVENWNGNPSPLIIVKGKLTNTELIHLNNASSSFFNEYVTKNRWLTSCIDGSENVYFRVNSLSDPVKVWALSYNLTEAMLVWKVIYEDGTFDTGDYLLNTTAAFKLFEINAHNVFIFEDISHTKTIVAYEIKYQNGPWLHVDVTNVYSEVHNELYILNRFGAVECLNCYGDKIEGGNTESEIFTKQMGRTASAYSRTIYQEQSSSQKTYKINTGYKTLIERRWISDLLRSPYKQAWLKVENSPNHIPNETFGIEPVTITTNSFDVDTTSEDLISVEIELEVAYND